jgi:hypothetical protein
MTWRAICVRSWCLAARDALAQLHSTFYARFENTGGHHVESGPGGHVPALPSPAAAAAASPSTSGLALQPRKSVLDSLVVG